MVKHDIKEKCLKCKKNLLPYVTGMFKTIGFTSEKAFRKNLNEIL